MKNILKKSFIDISVSCMIHYICFLLASFFPHLMNYTPMQRLIFYDLLFKLGFRLLIIVVLSILSYHFIMQTQLFNAKKSIRRGISVFVLFLLTFSINLSFFSFFIPIIPIEYVLVGVVSIAILGVMGAVAGFIIEDKFIKNDIKVINQRLKELKNDDKKV